MWNHEPISSHLKLCNCNWFYQKASINRFQTTDPNAVQTNWRRSNVCLLCKYYYLLELYDTLQILQTFMKNSLISVATIITTTLIETNIKIFVHSVEWITTLQSFHWNYHLYPYCHNNTSISTFDATLANLVAEHPLGDSILSPCKARVLKASNNYELQDSTSLTIAYMNMLPTNTTE